MSPQKRKADAVLPAEPADKSPHKRARSKSTDDTANKQNGNVRSSYESSDEHADPLITMALPSSSRAAPGEEDEAADLGDLPQTWDQAGAGDKLLVDIKNKYPKYAWARIEQHWERSMGKKPAEGILSDRYKHLKGIMGRSKADGRSGRNVISKDFGERLESSDDTHELPPANVRPSIPTASGPSDKSSHAISEHAKVAAKDACAASATEVILEEDLPQSWEQANPGDQLIVQMKSGRNSWARIGKAWQKLTGETPGEGAVKNRYELIKNLVVRPATNGAHTQKHPVKARAFDGASGQEISQHAKPTARTPRKRKAEAKYTEETTEGSTATTSNESADESSGECPNPSMTMADRKPRRASAFDQRSDEPSSKRPKTTAEEPHGETAEAESPDESVEMLGHTKQVVRPTKRSKSRPAVAANSGAQNTGKTADEMVMEMKERGCNWVEISKAWEEQTGQTRAANTFQKRYYRMKQRSATKPTSITQASSKGKAKASPLEEGSYESTQASTKRKAKASSLDEDSYESGKRSKATAEASLLAEAPIKRNMDRGKRKSSVKYTDSTTDEDEFYAAPTEPIATAPAKRNTGRAAKVNRSDPEWLVTNEKSPLADEDLHAEFSDPKTYENFTASDWEDLRKTLPSDVPVNPDGYSIPMKFLKYDPDFRRGIREFQEDLASGRLDPKWQADAAQAMEERARGEFDAYKESQFEAFWGQKQKLNHDALAGESTKIKLELLIQNEIFMVGDYFSYSRVFGRGKTGVLVEKDCKIVKVDSKALTFAIPPGQRKYSRRLFESGPSGDTHPGTKVAITASNEHSTAAVESRSNRAEVRVDIEINSGEGPQASTKDDGVGAISGMTENGNMSDIDSKETEALAEDGVNGKPKQPGGNQMELDAEPQDGETLQATGSEGNKENGSSLQTNGGDHSSAAASQDEDVLHSISYLTQLENKIVEIDGRFNPNDITTQNTWKNIRGIRNNQDLGTLFEMREEFYVYKHPQIVKEGKRKK